MRQLPDVCVEQRRTMKYGMALPSPPVPPTAPTPSPCVYTPQKRKYVPNHSGGMDPCPLRANPRISSRHSQAFFSRLSRSILCAFVSLTASGIVHLSAPKRKTHVSGASDAWVRKILLR